MSRRALFVLAGCVLLSFGAPGTLRAELARDQQPELAGRLEQLATTIATGHAPETRQTAAALRRWMRQLDAAAPVDLLCERATLLAHADFDPKETEARQLQTALRQLASDLRAAPPSAGDVDVPAARKVLADVLAGSEFQITTPPNWLQEILFTILRWLNRLFNALARLPGAQQVASVAFYILTGLLVLPLLALLGYLVWRQIKQRRPTPAVEAGAAITMLDSPDVHLAQAEEHLRRGEYREALKQFYLAALASLEQRGLVACDRTRTNWEYLTQLEARLADAEPKTLLRSLNRLYDRAVFGNQPCDVAYVREFSSMSQQLMHTVAGLAAPHA